MAIDVASLFVPTVHLVTLLITGTSAAFVVRQRTSEYLQVRNLLVIVHILYMAVVSFELVRNFVPVDDGSTSFFLGVYTISNTSFVLVDVLLLTLIALAIYYRPTGRDFWGILREVFRHQAQSTFFLVYAAYIAIAEGYLLAAQPFQPIPNPSHPMPLNNILGMPVIATQFNPLYLDMLLGILLIFLAYPSSILLAARSRTKDTQVKRAFAILPIAWVGIGADLLIFNGYLLNSGIDATSIGYLFAAAAFAATASTFRRATLLSAFFLPPTAVPSTPPPATTFSGRVGLTTQSIIGRSYLMEVEPSSKFEESIHDLATELGANQFVVFAFTAKGSPVYNSLMGLSNVRFFTMSTKVSYPKPGESTNEVLVPSGDQAVLLNVLDKAITSNPSLKFGVIFDSVTDLILSSGLETTYKFLKAANEMLSGRDITTVFLLTQGAHAERDVNIVKSLFGNLLNYASGALVVQKSG